MKKIFTFITMMLLATMSSMATTYTVAGVKAILNGDDSWKPELEVNDMTSEDGNLYTLTVTGKNLEANTYDWKIVEDHAWAKSYPQSGNNTLTITENGVYDITYTLNLSENAWDAKATKVGEYVPPTTEKTYTVAGSSAALFGTTWAPTETGNDMEKQADGTYKKVYEGVTLGAGNIEYKICVNYGWDEAYPGSNAVLAIPEDGTYNVTFTFNPSSKAVDATAEKAGEAVIEKDYFVAGQENLMGVDWTPDAAENQMTENEDGSYTLTKEVDLVAGETYAFKVVTNGDWNQPSFGDDTTESGNYEFTVETDGTYKVTFRFDPAKGTVSLELVNLTGIKSVQTVEFGMKNIIYNLAGQRVSKARGVVIVGGKKVVMK